MCALLFIMHFLKNTVQKHTFLSPTGYIRLLFMKSGAVYGEVQNLKFRRL